MKFFLSFFNGISHFAELLLIEGDIWDMWSLEWFNLSYVITYQLLLRVLCIFESLLLKSIIQFSLITEISLKSLNFCLIICFQRDDSVHLCLILALPDIRFCSLLWELFRQGIVFTKKLSVLFKNIINLSFNVFSFLSLERSEF